MLNRFHLVNSETWIQTVIKLQHDPGVCQKTEGNSAGDIYAGGERKKHDILYTDSNKSLTTRCNENNLRLHDKLLLSQ